MPPHLWITLPRGGTGRREQNRPWPAWTRQSRPRVQAVGTETVGAFAREFMPAGQFGRLLALLGARHPQTGIARQLAGEEVTLLLPTDAGIASVARSHGFRGRHPDQALWFLIAEMARQGGVPALEAMVEFALRHIAPGRHDLAGEAVPLAVGAHLRLDGTALVPARAGAPKRAALMVPGLRCTNGVVHVISAPLLPEYLRPRHAGTSRRAKPHGVLTLSNPLPPERRVERVVPAPQLVPAPRRVRPAGLPQPRRTASERAARPRSAALAAAPAAERLILTAPVVQGGWPGLAAAMPAPASRLAQLPEASEDEGIAILRRALADLERDRLRLDLED